MLHLKKNNVFNRLPLMAAAIFLTFFAACGGGGGSKPDDPPEPVVSINIFPPTAIIRAGRSATFTVTVTPAGTGFTVDAPGAGCTASGGGVTCVPPTATGEYELTVMVSTDTTKRSTARLSVLDAEDVDLQEGVHTELYGINNNGRVIGEFLDGFGRRTAFLTGGGGYSAIPPPSGATGNVYVYGINDSENILGFAGGRYFRRTGTVSRFIENRPQADFPDYTDINYTDINNSGYLVGDITDADGYSRGFIRIGDVFTLVDYPGADSACAQDQECGTWLTGINTYGHVAGVYRGSDGRYRGFIKDGDQFTEIVHPGGSFSIEISGINDSGQVVGYFWDSTGYSRGFMKDGDRFIEVIHPDASSQGNRHGTFLTGINNSGKATGWFDDGEKARGFLANF